MIRGIDVRRTYLRAAAVARDTIAASEVTAAWDEPSALDQFTVRGLAGHLARSGTLIEQYLDAGIPAEHRVVADAAEYLARAALTPDLDSALNVSIRERGEEMAAPGHAALVERLDATLARLGPRLAAEPQDAPIAVLAAMVLPLDEYLVTRIVELTVHTDDLACSVGLECPEPDPAAATLVLECLVTLARRRHGDLAVVRALARRERDAADALRAF